ncbi:MAG TPA: nucleotidyltransferase family protein [Longimicrobiaceae bacterium]|nr:nucleotidyltransferase family protein [Longimicrobiaceae bacterium]
MNKVVILAAGRGTRMRREAPGVPLDEQQRRMAEQGLKGLIPFHGCAFLDYVISAAADAGLGSVCLVVRPEPDPIRNHYQVRDAERVRIDFTIQEEPLGSAHALLAAESFAGEDPFVVINADNYYPAPLLARMHELEGSGMAGFQREALIAGGNIPAERVAAYALVTTDAGGFMTEIIEKPDPETARALEGRSWVSMTCWRFGPSIFEACRSIAPSVRGEYELPDAVSYAIRELGERFRVIPVHEPVLDLSSREDIPSVAEWLRGREVRL